MMSTKIMSNGQALFNFGIYNVQDGRHGPEMLFRIFRFSEMLFCIFRQPIDRIVIEYFKIKIRSIIFNEVNQK